MQNPPRQILEVELDRKFSEEQQIKAQSCACGNGPDWSEPCAMCALPVCIDHAVFLADFPGKRYCGLGCANREMDIDDAADRLLAAEHKVARKQMARETAADFGVEGVA